MGRLGIGMEGQGSASRRWLFGIGLGLVVLPLVACLAALPLFPPGERIGNGVAEEEPTPTPPLAQAALWSLVALPVGATLVVKLGLRRPDRLAGMGRRSLLLGEILPSAVLAVLGGAVLAACLLHLRLWLPLVLATEAAFLFTWWQTRALVRSVGRYRGLGPGLGWPPTRAEPTDAD